MPFVGTSQLTTAFSVDGLLVSTSSQLLFVCSSDKGIPTPRPFED